MTHTPSQSLLTKITNLANMIVGLVSTHENKTSSSSQKGHSQAGSTPQALGKNLAAGTDNGFYARADHVHTVSYDNVLNKPTSFTPSSHTHNQYFSNVEVTYDDTTGNLKIKLT